MYSNVFQSLLTFQPGFTTPVPDAAESCKFVDTKLTTYRCELRDDLTFSNGRKVTGEDVVYSFERMLGIKSDVGPQPLFPTLKTVVADGRTVTFHLSGRDATFPAEAGDRRRFHRGPHAVPGEEAARGRHRRRLGAVRPEGVQARRERAAGAQPVVQGRDRQGGRPGRRQVLHRVRGAGLRVEGAGGRRHAPADAAAVPLHAGDRRELTGITEAQTAEIRNLYFNVKSGSPMAEKAVRQAVAAVIDRPAIVTGAYHDTVQPLYSLIPQGFNGHSTSFYDRYPEPSRKKAEALLEDADVETPVRFTLGYRKDATYAAEVAELKRQLEETGLFEVKLVEAEWKEFQKAYVRGDYDAYPVGWLPDFPDSDSFTAPLVGTGNAMHNGFGSKKIDSLIYATQQYSDRAAAANAFEDIQTEVAADVPLVPLWQKKDYVLATEDVAGSQYLSDGTGLAPVGTQLDLGLSRPSSRLSSPPSSPSEPRASACPMPPCRPPSA
ncbi:Solute-binding transport lipoprotein OS=Streptomyces antimycoticus OX=68175 GN=SSPO_077190 PE=3 SV=1 [Streptomyces antimycoticus]